jgi:hydroxymethylbilane synthase
LAPVGAWGRVEDGQLHLDGAVLSADGKQRIGAACQGSPQEPETVGTAVAQQLLAAGAGELIAASRR